MSFVQVAGQGEINVTTAAELSARIKHTLEKLNQEYRQAEQVVQRHRTDRGHTPAPGSPTLVEELRPILARLQDLDAKLKECHRLRREQGWPNTPEQQRFIDSTMQHLHRLLEQVDQAAREAHAGCQMLMPHLTDQGARQKMRQAYPQSSSEGSRR